MSYWNNKNVVIVGAANGLGKSIAQALFKEHCNLILIDKDLEALELLHFKPSSQKGDFIKFQCDIANSSQIRHIANKISHRFPVIHALFNSAAVSITAPLSEMNVEDFEWLNRINYLGSFYSIKFLLPLLKKSDKAHIVNIASGAAFQGLPNRSAYVGSKFAIRGFSESLMIEFHNTNIQVHCAFPGPIDTSMYLRSRHSDDQFLKKEKEYLKLKGYSPDIVAEQIIKGVKKGKSYIVIGKEVKMGYLFKRLFPGLFLWIMKRFQDKLPV